MTPMLETIGALVEAVALRSLLGALLIGLLMVVTLAGRNVIAPRVRFWLWLLVPLQLLWCVPVSSSLSLLNVLPARNVAKPQRQVQSQEATQSQTSSSHDNNVAVTNVSRPFEWDAEFDDFSRLHEETEMPASPTQSESLPAVEQADHRASWKWYATVIWVAGAVLFYTLTFMLLLRFQHGLRSAKTLTDEKTLRLFEQCKQLIHINTWVLLVESPKVQGPFLIGVFRPVIVLPRAMVAALNDDELQHLFSHELAHLKRSDLIVGWLMAFVLGLYWFNPLVWLAVGMMNQLREEACDAMVVDSLDQERKLDYGSTLLTLSRKFANPRFVPGIAGILETRSFLHRRIDMITEPKTWRKRWSLLAAGLCLGVLATLVTNAQPQDERQAATPYISTKPIYETQWQPPANAEPIVYTVGLPVYETRSSAQGEIDPRRVPKIIATYPKNNAKDVDPNITQVYVTFDIPMGGGRAWAQRSNQTALDFDEEQQLFWTADRRTCVAPVKLKANKTYEILMNVPPFIGFASEAGVASRQLIFTFKTGRGPVSESARAEHAAKNLSETGKSPAVEGFNPNEGVEEKYVDAELEKKGRQVLKSMAERGRYWIFSQCREAESWSYHFNACIILENDAVKPDSEREYDIEVDRKKGSAPWEKIRGITYYSVLQALASLAVNEETADEVRFKAVTQDDNEIKLHFVVPDHDLGCRIGNGMNGSWYGFFERNKMHEGQLTLDRKTLTPKTLVCDDEYGERYGKFVTVGAAGLSVPQRIQIKNGDMLFDMYFNVYEPGLWLLDSSVYTVKLPDGDEFRSKAEVTGVQVNDKPGQLIEK